jgi:hypothetical protein
MSTSSLRFDSGFKHDLQKLLEPVSHRPFYFRFHLPVHAATALGVREIRRTLVTKDAIEARKRAFEAFQAIRGADHGSNCFERLDGLIPRRPPKFLHLWPPQIPPPDSSNAKCLSFPRITSRAAVLPAQRHVPDSLATLRHQLSFRLIARLRQCPCCGRPSAKRLF